MANTGRGFTKGISPYLQNSANILSRGILQNAQYEREVDAKFQEHMAKERLKQQENIWLQKYLTDPSNENYVEGLQYYEPGKLNSLTKGLFPKEEKKPQYIHDRTLPNGYQAQIMYGYEDPEGKYEYDGKKYRVTSHGGIYNLYKRAPKDGKKEGEILGFSDEVEKGIKEYRKQMFDWKAQLDALESGRTLVDRNGIPLLPEDAEAQYNSVRAKYKEYVENILTPDAKQWQNDFYEAWHNVISQSWKNNSDLSYDEVIQQATSQPPADKFIENAVSQYMDNNLGKTDKENYMAFRGLSELFTATYGYSPIQLMPKVEEILNARF